MRFTRSMRLGPYEIAACIGGGGMGEVYRAWDTRLERNVAVKVLAERLASDPQALARFQVEAKAIANLSHPNILSVYDAELEHPPLYLVTELLEGETLRRRLQQSPVPWRLALPVASAIADGLAAAHEASVIHRDLKPENIFLTRRGVVKILDFGLARFRPLLQEDCDQVITVTLAGSFVGTVGYVAPEQARGEAVTPAADIFSLGCILYEMITGRAPFHGSTVAATIASLLNDDPQKLSAHVPGIPAELERWIAHCLRKDAGARPQSARDLKLVFQELTADSAEARRVAVGGSEDFDSLAVLPFVTSCSSPDAEYLADGITETLINNFAQLPDLKVMARSTVFRHKGKEVDPMEVGRNLGVSAVLTGRVFQRGDILVIGAELVSMRDGRQLWGQTYRRALADIFAIEEEISREISERLRVRFAPGGSLRLSKRYTENPEAYQLYLKGRFSWNRRTIEGMQTAFHYFEQAVEVDPSYARAYTGMSDCLMMLAVYGAVDPRQSHARAKAAQDMAIEIDAGLGEAHASRGMRFLALDRSFREAEQTLRHALHLNPGYASAHQWLGFVLALTGRLGEARAAMRTAQQLDPFSASINTTAVYPLYWAHLFDEAAEGFRNAVQMHPGFWLAHYYLGLTYAHQGDLGNAISALRYAAEIGDTPWRFSGLGYVLARAGQAQKAKRILHDLDDIERQQYVAPIYRAAIYAGLGAHYQAVEHLRHAVDERNMLVMSLHQDPLWDGLRSDSRLLVLQSELGLPTRQ